MNVLILTPDAVGSTLLQRLITIYMQFHEFDRPVINLHELTNGLEKYYSPEFNREIVSKRRVKNWGYYQSLEQIVELLSSVDHYKTSRLAQYHIKGRQDPLDKQIPFYQYLDNNFFVISCRRKNIFEHALSMSLNSITKKLNVYSHQEKLHTFIDMYQNQVNIDKNVFVYQLESYKQYIKWSSDHFNIGSFFYYDQHLENIERYILDLPIFGNHTRKITWKEKFDIEFNDWNRFHHIGSDLDRLSDDGKKAIADQSTLDSSYYVVIPRTNNVIDISDNATQNFIERNKKSYQSVQEAINLMQQLDIITSPPPIKKQTLAEKIKIIKNFDRCLDTYNEWILDYPDLGEPFDKDEILNQGQKERQFWNSFTESISSQSGSRSTEKLGYRNDDNL